MTRKRDTETSISAGRFRRLARLRGIIGVGTKRVLRRALGKTPGQTGRTRMAILGVALAIALMVLVSSIALGLALGTTVASEDVNYWIVPEGGAETPITFAAGGPQLGQVHETTAELTADSRISYATPVLLSPIPLDHDDSRSYILAIGVIPPEHDQQIAGLSAGTLDASYPYYTDGEWSGDLVLNEAAAEALGVDSGDTVSSGDRPMTVRAIEAGSAGGLDTLPVGMVALAELQSVTGVTETDPGDQILVTTTDPDVRDDIAGVYPHTDVVTRAGLTGQELSEADLPLAVALTATVVALTVGVLFVGTMMGLELYAGRTQLAVLGTIGYGSWSRAGVVATETIVTAGIGGVFGTILGYGGIWLLNLVLETYFDLGRIGIAEPLLLGYGPLVAVLIGFLAAPYPVLLSRRADPLEVVQP